MIDRALSGERLPVYGDGANIRDWIHVDDHCDGIWKALNVGISGHTYNFGGNNQTRNIDLVKMILSQLGKSEELIEFVEDRKGHDFRYDIDCMKANMKLGWRARVGFKEGIAATIEWYTRNIQKS